MLLIDTHTAAEHTDTVIHPNVVLALGCQTSTCGTGVNDNKVSV